MPTLNKLSKVSGGLARDKSDLQETRLLQERMDLDSLIDIMEMCESEGETYDPSADGFVFSELQIKERIRTRNRERRAEEAYDYRLESEAAA